MERFVKGDVVVVPFPFSDLSSSKKRPALVIAKTQGDDLILVQITSAARFDNYAIVLENKDFSENSLHQTSMIRPNKLFTADSSIIAYVAAKIKTKKIKEVEEKLINIIRG